MKKTIRPPNKSTATLDASKKEKLVYTLTKTGPGADFVMADAASSATTPPIFSEDDLGGSLLSSYKWELRANAAPPGANREVRLVFHRTDGTQFGSRILTSTDPDGFLVITLVMTFMFLGKYTLAISHCDANGKVIAPLVDSDFEGEQPTDTADKSIMVQWKGV